MKGLKLGLVVVAALLTGLGSAAAQQSLKVGRSPLTAGQPPFFIDVSQAVAKAANLQIQFEEIPFGDLVTALAAKKIDIAASTLTKTPEREAVADYTQPFASFRDALMISAADTRTYKTIADMKGLTLGVVRGAIYIPPLRQAGAIVVEFDTNDAIVAAMESGQVAGGVTNSASAFFIVANRPKYKLVASYEPISLSQISLLVQKGNAPLLASLNAAITKLKADGSLKALAEKGGYGYVP